MSSDIVVIGGGIGGCALAIRLAAAGLTVTVLERETAYRDQVRGEAIAPWGFAEATAMGLGDVVAASPGCSVMTRLITYDETADPAKAREHAQDLSTALAGVPGIIGVGHPELREALATAAVTAGARMVRGVGRSTVTAGKDPSVTYQAGPKSVTEDCRLIVVADGKNSATRGALGVPLHVTKQRVMLAGMLVDDRGAWDRAETAIGVDGRNLFIVLPRAGQRIRLYIGRSAGDPDRFTGPDRERRFLETYRTPILPEPDLLAGAEPAGPCASFPMTDGWTDTPVIPGAALLGDAAGWSNPTTAQGLSVALRDARVLSEALLDTTVWTPETLRGYSEERAERMSRLRFTTALTDLLTGFGLPDRAQRRQRTTRLIRSQPELAAAIRVIHAGPWSVPAEAFSPDILTTLALAP
jgi:2-polyprenyl-6-methoxyphenol hydroxylase-like FAD-dependent oxidoreductase